MNDIAIFIFGALIFVGYMTGLLWMVNKQHKIQAGEWDKKKKTRT